MADSSLGTSVEQGGLAWGRTCAGRPGERLTTVGMQRHPPVTRCHRSMLTSTKRGSSSIARARRPVRSAAISVVPAPPNGSRTTPPRLEQSRIASAIMATGLTAGCRASLLFAVPFSAFWLT